MTTPDIYLERRRKLAQAALADDTLMNPDERCKGAFAKRPRSGEPMQHCYVGLAYNLVPGAEWTPSGRGDGAFISPGPHGVSNIVSHYYALPIRSLTHLISLSEGGAPVEDINAALLNSPTISH